MKGCLIVVFLILVNSGFSLGESVQDNQKKIQKLRYNILKGAYFNKINDGMSNYHLLKKEFANSDYQIFHPGEELFINLCLYDFGVITNVNKLIEYFSNSFEGIYAVSLPEDDLMKKFYFIAKKNEQSIMDKYLLTAESEEQIEFYKLITFWLLHNENTNKQRIIVLSTNFIRSYANSPYNQFIKCYIINMSSSIFSRDKLIVRAGFGFSMFGSFNSSFNDNVGVPIGITGGIDMIIYNICIYPHFNMTFSKVMKPFDSEQVHFYSGKDITALSFGLFLGYALVDEGFPYARMIPGIGFTCINHLSQDTLAKSIGSMYYSINIGLVADFMCLRFKIAQQLTEISLRTIMDLNIPVNGGNNSLNDYSMHINFMFLIGPVFLEPKI